ELLQDVKTRWDSSHGMLERAIAAQPAIKAMLRKCKFHELQSKNLSDEQWNLADKIHEILSVIPHSIQQLMLGEATPILSGVLPTFQQLQNCWEDHAAKQHDISQYVYEGMEWLNKYHDKVGKSPTYVISMGTSGSHPSTHGTLSDHALFVPTSHASYLIWHSTTHLDLIWPCSTSSSLV
ncbi:hypothetical protein BS47DRAFT_1292893, partial [Hydnum rufescens UP504]